MDTDDLRTSLSNAVGDYTGGREAQLDQLTALVHRAVDAMDRELEAMRAALLAEVSALGQTIAVARNEVAKLRSEHQQGFSPIPGATDELDAIVEHTAAATETILGACEALDEVATGLDEAASGAINAQTIRIFEACSFQDITGQRISKVVGALKLIEARIDRLAFSFGPGAKLPDEDEIERDPLLNGPQATHAAMDQDAIDRLLTF